MRQKSVISILFLLMVLMTISCGDRSDNRKLVEAASVYDKMIIKYDSVHDMLKAQEARVEARLSQLSATDPDRAAYESMSRSISRSYSLLASWKDGLAEVPNYSQNPENGNTTNERGLSDQTILDLQK